MNKLSLILTLTTLFLVLVVVTVALDNNHFGVCSPVRCGDTTITYPFYIPKKQEDFCGYPGFKVICKNGKIPHVNISGNSYVIRNIWYQNQSFVVANSAFVNSVGNNCLDSIRNLTLQNDIYKFPHSYRSIILLPNCTDKILGEYVNDRITCGALGFYEGDPKLKNLTKECGGQVVSVPYEGETGGDIAKVLSRGIVLDWTAKNCTACTESGGECGFSRNTHLPLCYCRDRAHSYHCVHTNAGKRNISALVGSVVVASAVGIAILMALLVYSRRRKSGNNKIAVLLRAKGTTRNQNVETFLKSYGSLAPKRYSYQDIRKMTSSFEAKLGEGGYGAVYKGKLHSGRFVAVKVLKQLKGSGEDFINEVVSIGRTNHVNIVSLLGFCFEGKKRALVYDFLANGSLEKFMYGVASGQLLPLKTLFRIAVGIARGLDYLHRGCNTQILHFDIKPHNILLDEEFRPKISDFGLARLCLGKDSVISMSNARGTIGYIAPEVWEARNLGGVSHRSDVYSYGMMVLEMVCGRKDNNTSVDVQCSSSELYFPHWIYKRLEVGDENFLHKAVNDNDKKLQMKMILVSLWCIQMQPSKRPSINRVLEMLQGPLESLEMPPEPDASSSSKPVFDSSTEPHSQCDITLQQGKMTVISSYGTRLARANLCLSGVSHGL